MKILLVFLLILWPGCKTTQEQSILIINQKQEKKDGSSLDIFVLSKEKNSYKYGNAESGPKYSGDMVCPLGHNTLHTLPAILGCLRSDDDPKEVLVCSKCFYFFNTKYKYWEQEGNSTKNFSLPLSQIVSCLPIPIAKLLSRDISYHQYWKNGKVRWEYVVCRSNEDYLTVIKRVKQFLKENNVDLSTAKETDQSLNCESKWKEFKLNVKIAYVNDYDDVYVKIELRSEGESIWER